MTEQQEKRLLQIIDKIPCPKAMQCYETGRMKARLETRELTLQDLKDLLNPKTKNCPYEEVIAVTRVCNCPLCDSSTICREPFWSARAGKEA